MITIKKITLIFNFCLLPFTFNLSSDTWVKTYRPFQEPYMEDRYFVEDVIVTQDSGYVVSGSFELYDDFYYEHWGFLMKTDKDGNMLWAVKDSVDFMDENGYSVEFLETSNGGFLTIGYQGFGGQRYMIRRDSAGNCLWTIPYNTDIGVFSMQNTQDGNIIIGGRSDYNAALRKITEEGSTLWTKIVDVGSSIAYSIYECNNEDYLLTGINFDNYDILVIRTDSIGDSIWTRTFDGLGGHDQGNCIIETDDEKIMLIGEIHSRSIDTFLGFYDKYGEVIWEYIRDDLASGKTVLQTIDGNFVAYSWGGASTQQTHLFKFDDTQFEIWNQQLVFYPANGDRCFRELTDGSFICGGEAQYGNDKFFLAKTDSLGQVVSIDYPGSPNNNLSMSIFPNPVLDNCKIVFNNYNLSLKYPSIRIYNIKGQMIRELEIENNELGIREIIWDGTAFNGEEVQNGIYFLKLESNNNKTAKKVTKIK